MYCTGICLIRYTQVNRTFHVEATANANVWCQLVYFELISCRLYSYMGCLLILFGDTCNTLLFSFTVHTYIYRLLIKRCLAYRPLFHWFSDRNQVHIHRLNQWIGCFVSIVYHTCTIIYSCICTGRVSDVTLTQYIHTSSWYCIKK